MTSIREHPRTLKCNTSRLLTSVLVVLVVLETTLVSAQTTTTKDESEPASKPPNFVILFADNLAYSDLSSLGGPPGRTPNIDRLGQQGLTFQHWNSAAHLCSASRATLLTAKYAARRGVYLSVFRKDAAYGLMPFEVNLAKYLQQEGYATSLVGKWHLGHRPPYLPTKQGFDEWVGIPYHMSGGSLDDHVCAYDGDQSWWLPLYENEEIVEQPVKIRDLADRYASRATGFIEKNVAQETPFFLYLAFSHVHQLCAPKAGNEQETCQWAGSHNEDSTSKNSNSSGKHNTNKTFGDAVQEMDWIAGEVLKALDTTGAANNTLVLFTSDNGPWLAEQSCSGSRGPWEGKWLADNVDPRCTACPHDYVPDPTQERPRRCRLTETSAGTEQESAYLDGVHCGQDVGLGSVWEANLRMPAFARFPGKIKPNTTTKAVVSTLDVFPTFLSLLNASPPPGLDGVDISPVLFGREESYNQSRVLYFWRDGFSEGPLPAPYGRMDVAAVKIGHLKAWFWTKSAHYNDDPEVYHSPPLLFNIENDPAEATPLNPDDYQDFIETVETLVEEHKNSIDWTFRLALTKDRSFRPCADPENHCRTSELVHEETLLSVD